MTEKVVLVLDRNSPYAQEDFGWLVWKIQTLGILNKVEIIDSELQIIFAYIVDLAMIMLMHQENIVGDNPARDAICIIFSSSPEDTTKDTSLA